MTNLQKLSAWFESQLGTTEKPPGSNNVIYNTDFYGADVSGPNFPWCCAFIWCGFHDTGLRDLFCDGAKTAYCPFVVDYARRTGQWVTDGYRWGDLLLYDWDGDGVADHIGFCYSVDGSTLTTIEGNVQESVMKLTRTASAVMGAYRPDYGEVFDAPDDPTGEDTDVPTNEDTYTVKPGDTLWGIAEAHGMTYQELARINNIDPSNYIHPGQVLKLREDNPPVVVPDDVYVVQPGDSLWQIAQHELGKGWKWYRIAEANHLSAPYIIHPGQRLTIPKGEI